MTVRRQQTFDSFVLAIGSCSLFPVYVRVYNLCAGGLGLSMVVSDLPPVSKTVFTFSGGAPEDDFPIKLLRIRVQ